MRLTSLALLALAACNPSPEPRTERDAERERRVLPSELWCGKQWKRRNYPGAPPGIDRYLPTGVPDLQVDLVSWQCRSACCREAPKVYNPGDGTWIETGPPPPGIVAERVEIRGWVIGDASLHLAPRHHPSMVENEITFDLQLDIDWKWSPSEVNHGRLTTPLNSVASLLRYTTPIQPGEDPAALAAELNVLPPIKVHVEINGWGARACRRSRADTLDPKTLCEFAGAAGEAPKTMLAAKPPGWNHEIFLHERELQKPGLTGEDYADCHVMSSYDVALPALSSWYPFNVMPSQEGTADKSSGHCLLQRTPSGEVHSPWDESKNADGSKKGWRQGTIHRGTYVRLVGTLWEDGNHNQQSCWNGKGSFSAERGWVEMHPVDELHFPPPPPYPPPQPDLDGDGEPDSGYCSGVPVAGDPMKTRCIVQLCSAESPDAPARRKMPTFRWRPAPNLHCEYQVTEVVDKESLLTSFTRCMSFRDGKCATGSVTTRTIDGRLVLDAEAIGQPGRGRGLVRAAYDITAVNCCTPKCAGRCGGPNGCGGECSSKCPGSARCNPTTHRCEGFTEVDCEASCRKENQDCIGLCSAMPKAAACKVECAKDLADCLNGKCGK